MRDTKVSRVIAVAGCLLLLVLVSSPAVAEKKDLSKVPGYVDGAGFIELVGDEAVMIEVSIHGALLKVLASVDPELQELVGGLESIHAVILEADDDKTAARILDLMRRTERRLMGQGWERLARVRDDETEVKVLVLNDDKAILGLVVMVAGDDKEFVFANIAGTLNLAAIAAIGESFDIPGLDELGSHGE